MRHLLSVVVGLGLCAALGQVQIAAQPQAPPTIHRVTVQPDTGVLTISGTGLGSDLTVMVEGQPVTVLSGATGTQLEVVAPVVLLTTPGTYRLSVVDSVRRLGDAFIVASPAGRLAGPSFAIPRRVAAGENGAGTGGVNRQSQEVDSTTMPLVTESGCLTAVGSLVLFDNTTGCYLTGVGYAALFSNTTGSHNTAIGDSTLSFNVSGSYNTATGSSALYHNSGDDNTANGRQALYWNAGGYQNTASGAYALYFNTTGAYNVASGTRALAANTSGSNNTGVGNNAGAGATTGSYNVFLGADVLGTAADANTMRLGLPYDSGTGAGQNRTFVAGIHGTQLTGPAVQVFVDASGQLGTLTVPVATGSIAGGLGASPRAEGEPSATIRALRRQVEQLRATDTELRARLAKLEAQLQALAAASRR